MSADRAPTAVRRPVRLTRHGTERIDDYAWLRAGNWREVMRDPSRLAPEIRAYLDAENAHAEAVLRPLVPLRELLLREMKGRIREDDATVPAPDGDFAYAMRYVTGGQHPHLIRTRRDGSTEETLLDADLLAEGRPYFRLGASDHSPDHRWLAYAVDDSGGEFYSIRLRDLASGEDLPVVIDGTSGTFAWGLDSRHLYYIRLDDGHRPRWVYRHALGQDPQADTLVYEETDPGFFLGIGRTQSRRFVTIDAHDHETSEVMLLDAADPAARPVTVAPREAGMRYAVDHHGEQLVIRTNADGAEDFKVVTAPLRGTGREGWRDLVAHRQGRPLLDILVLEDHLVRLEREDGLPRIVVRRWSDGAEHGIAFEEEAYALGLLPGYEFDTRVIRFSYASPTTPTRVYDYDLETRERRLRKEQEVPSGHDTCAYVARRLQAPAPDGELVPVTVLHRRDLVLDGSAPVLLHGYGAYGITLPAGFGTNVFSLVDRGFVHAVAHVRGGRDKGERWRREGQRAAKANSFTDFIAVAEHLVREGFTSAGRIVAQGGSAGGLLMGAVANLRPDLFLGIIAEVPFVDVLNTMLDDSLPLTPPEWPEWGDPIRDKAAYETIASYAPYENVRAQAYPHMLVVAGLTDPRVTYWEPAKWVARLRERRTDDRLLLLVTHMEAGHAGAPGRFDRLREVALNYAFALHVAGLAAPAEADARHAADAPVTGA